MSELLISTLLPFSLAFIMYGMGITLTVSDFTRIIKHPKAVIYGLSVQTLVFPLVGYALIKIFNFDTSIAIGIIILTACPGGATSNMVTQICRGNIALSITLTALTTFTSIFTTQLLLSFALPYFSVDPSTPIVLPFWDTTQQILLITGLPIGLGMITKEIAPYFASKLTKPMKTASSVLFLLILTGLIVTNFGLLAKAFQKTGNITLLLNLLILSIGFLGGKLLKLSTKDSITVAAEGSIQNGTLAFYIATTLLNNVEMSMPTITYVVWMYLTGGVLMWALGFNKKRHTKACLSLDKN